MATRRDTGLELGLIDEYELVVQPSLVGHGPTLFAGLSKRVDLKLVSRLEFGSGAVAMRYAREGSHRMGVKRQLLFVQGGGAGAHDEWDSKLVESLGRELGPDYEIRYPRMPNEDDPSYAAWKATIEREFATLDDGAILVGHSVGATILVNALAEEPSERKFGAIFLIAAPFVGKGGWPGDDLKPPRDLGARLPRGLPIHFYHGLDDETAPPSHAELYARAVPQARVHRLPGRNHQLNDDLKEVGAAIRSLEAGL